GRVRGRRAGVLAAMARRHPDARAPRAHPGPVARGVPSDGRGPSSGARRRLSRAGQDHPVDRGVPRYIGCDFAPFPAGRPPTAVEHPGTALVRLAEVEGGDRMGLLRRRTSRRWAVGAIAIATAIAAAWTSGFDARAGERISNQLD